MCGILGIYNCEGNINPEGVLKGIDLLRHRGPDDEGFLSVNLKEGLVHFFSGNSCGHEKHRIEVSTRHADLLLGHRRLSIIPMRRSMKRFIS